MKAINIENIKKFTTQLFAGEAFDRYLMTEASFSTLTNLTIDGHINPDFLDDDARVLPENREGTVSWKKMRPLCYEIIKGKRVPLRFKIVFRMPADLVKGLLAESGLAMDPQQVNGLFLNVNFQEGKLVCTTGTSMKEFTLDKSLEYAWDAYAEHLLNQIQG